MYIIKMHKNCGYPVNARVLNVLKTLSEDYFQPFACQNVDNVYNMTKCVKKCYSDNDEN